MLRKLYYKIFPTYKVLELKMTGYSEADDLIRSTQDLSEEEQWVLADQEDNNKIIGIVWLCRKVRIYE